MTGLAHDFVDDLVERLTESGLWQAHRRRALDPHRSVVVTLLYLRHSLSQRLLAEPFGCCQSTMSCWPRADSGDHRGPGVLSRAARRASRGHPGTGRRRMQRRAPRSWPSSRRRARFHLHAG
ncbi:transposase family protein [Hamadaea tsunoensis]|uniref:transposase family protein n=1 Tax=Hamadaea tsunoensis TaxID=53368 RepID=UPI0038994043